MVFRNVYKLLSIECDDAKILLWVFFGKEWWKLAKTLSFCKPVMKQTFKGGKKEKILILSILKLRIDTGGIQFLVDRNKQIYNFHLACTLNYSKINQIYVKTWGCIWFSFSITNQVNHFTLQFYMSYLIKLLKCLLHFFSNNQYLV